MSFIHSLFLLKGLIEQSRKYNCEHFKKSKSLLEDVVCQKNEQNSSGYLVLINFINFTFSTFQSLLLILSLKKMENHTITCLWVLLLYLETESFVVCQ